MGMPEIGSRAYEEMIEFMRADLENDMAYSRIINTAKKKVESEGRDFWQEFEQWKRGG